MNSRILILMCCLMTLFSCKPKYSDIYAEGKFRLSATDLQFQATAKALSIAVGGSYTWRVDSTKTDKWCKITPIYRHEGRDYVTVDVEANEGLDVRETTFDIVSDYDRKTITVAQIGSRPAILFNKERILHRSMTKTVIDIGVVSNLTFTLTSTESWLKVVKPYVDDQTPIRVSLDQNTTGEVRSAKLIFKQVDGEYNEEIEIIQSNTVVDYEQENIDKVEGNKKLVVAGAGAETTPSIEGKGIELSYDNDPLSHYQSIWQGNTNPVVLEYKFEGEEALDYIIYSPYVSDAKKLFGKTEIWTKSVGEEYKKQLTHNFAGEQTQTVMMPEKVLNPESVKFVVLKDSYPEETDVVVCCSEMAFYASAIHYPNIFSDKSYSKLLDGVTYDDIIAMDDEFFRTIAEYLFNGTYPMIRCRDYNAYPSPSAASYVTKAPGLFDNVTGIQVTRGEEIIVMVDNVNGQDVQLTTLKPGLSSFHQMKVRLTEGITRIQIEEDGLLYIQYHTPSYATAAPVTIHIAGGKVNGYYDTQAHTEQQGIEAINRCGGAYFDLLGKYVHLIFPTSELKKNSTKLKQLVDKYDKIAELQREFIGMDKYPDEAFKNRVCLMSVSDMVADEANNVIFLSESLISFYANPDQIKDDILWELSSAMSRAFTPGALRWNPAFRDLNTIYVTTNMSRENKFLKDNIYESAADRFILKYEPIENINMATCPEMAVPLWQIYLYMKEVENKPDFFKDVFFNISQMAAYKQNQDAFLKEVNEVSKIDFQKFFKEWSFSKFASAKPQSNKAPLTLKLLSENSVDMFKSDVDAAATKCNYYADTQGSKKIYVMEIVGAVNIVGCEVITKGKFELHYSTKFTLDEYAMSTRVVAIGVDGERIELECFKINKPR